MKRMTALILAALMLFSLTACGSSKNSYVTTAAAPAMMEYAAAEDEMRWDADNSGFAAMSVEAPAEAGTDSGAMPEADPEKIIYSADATVETTEFESALEKLNELIAHYGGFIETSSVSGANFYDKSRGWTPQRSAYYTLRFPSARFSEVMGSLSTLGNVPYSHTYAENISAQYYDSAARLKAYRTQEDSLLALMERAESIEDIITIQAQLTDVRYEIENIQSRLNNWDRQVSYSTVSLSIEEVREYTPEPQQSFLQRLGRAFTDGFKNFGDFVVSFVLWLAESLPTLAVLAVIAALAVRAGKKIKIKRRNKKNKEDRPE